MPIRVFKSGIKADREIIEKLTEPILEGKAYIITPTNGGALTVRRQLVKKGPLIGNRVMSFYEFTKRAALPYPVILPNELKLLLLCEILESLKVPTPTLESLKPLLTIITSVKKNSLSIKNDNSVMSKLYSRYCDEISKSPFIDDADLTLITIDKLKNKKANIPSAIGFVGFGRFDSSETKIIELINKYFPETNIFITHPYLPKETLPFDCEIEKIDSSPISNNNNFSAFELSNNSAERRFTSRNLANRKFKTIISRQGTEGNPSITNQLMQEGLKSLGHPHLTDTGWGRLDEIINKVSNNDKKISDWLADFVKTSDKIAKEDTKFANNELLETISHYSTWSSLILKAKHPRHIFLEMLQMMSSKSASLITLNSAYPFNWVLFEDGIYPNEPAILNNMIAASFPRSSSNNHPIASGGWSKVINRNPTLEDEYLFKRLIESIPEIVFTFSKYNSSGQENYKSPFLDLLNIEIQNISSFPLVPNSIAFDERLTLETQRIDGTLPEDHLGIIRSKDGLKLIEDKLGNPIKLRVTNIERYANCPFEFFVRHILGAKELEEKGLALLPKDKGEIAHNIFNQLLDDKTLSLSDDQLEKHINNILDSIEDKLPEYLHKALWKWERSVLTKWCLNVVNNAKENAKLPKGPINFFTEWSFGSNNKDYLEYTLSNGSKIHLSGRIDRIDTSKDNSIFSIIDYKSGSAKVTKSEVEKGLHLQTPIYMDAVEKLLLPNSTPAYASLYSPKENAHKITLARKDFNKQFFNTRSKSQFDDESFDKLRENIRHKVREYVEEILKGKFNMSEDNDKRKCERCKIRPICKYED